MKKNEIPVTTEFDNNVNAICALQTQLNALQELTGADIQEIIERKELIELITQELQGTSAEALAEIHQQIAALNARDHRPVAGTGITVNDRTVSLAPAQTPATSQSYSGHLDDLRSPGYFHTSDGRAVAGTNGFPADYGAGTSAAGGIIEVLWAFNSATNVRLIQRLTRRGRPENTWVRWVSTATGIWNPWVRKPTMADVESRAPLHNPGFTGNPTVPTPPLPELG